MSERFEIFPQNITKDGTLIIIQKGLKLYNISDVVDLLNELNDEKKELQFQCNLLREQSNEFHRRAIENANRVGQLEKENKELKYHLNRSEKELKEYKDFMGLG